MKRFKLKLLLVCALTILFGAAPGTVGVSLASPGQPGSSGHFRVGYSRGVGCHLIPDTDHVVVGLSCTDDILEGYSCAPLGAQVVEVRYSVFIESHPLEQISCNDYEIYLSSDNHGGATKHLLVYDNLGSMRDGGHDDDPENDHDIYLEWRSTHAFDGENPNQNWYLWVEDTQGWNRGCLASVDFEIHWGDGGPPQNDDCSYAKPVGNVTNLPFDTSEATYDGPACSTAPNLWYCYTATCTGNITVSLCGSSFDTKLAVYEGCNCYPTPSDLIECNNDYCGQQSQITFTAVAGNQYLIEVGGYGNKTGQGVLSISCEEPPGPELPNDDCSKAIPVGDVTNLPFDTTEATFDGPGLCMTSPNIWYCYTASCTGEATVSLCGSSFDTKLAVYKNCDCYLTPGDLTECNDDYCGQQSQITFAAIAGNQYLIEVGGYSNETGQGVLSISCEELPGPELPNDDCSKAIPVGDVTNLPFDTTEATFDGPGHCMTSANLWYCYTASCTGEATVSLCGSSYDTKLAVYKGCGCYLTASNLIDCIDEYYWWSCEQLTFATIAGNQYLIEVGGYLDETGQGVLSISCEGPPPAGQLDFGDAPDSTNNFSRAMTAYTVGWYTTIQANFPTVFDDGSTTGPFGPFHRHPLAVAHLGQNVSLEVEADIGPDQDGINNIHPQTDSANKDGADDGVILPLSLPDCGWATIDYTVKVIDPGTDLYVNVWFDWNRDGDWDDNSSTDPTLNCGKGFVSEWAVKNQLLFNLPAGLNQITTPAFMAWHPEYGSKEVWMRITLSEQPWKGGETPGKLGNGGSGPQAGYDFGETEDYLVTPIISEPDCALCEDLNGDGKIDNQDLNVLVNQWLQKCM